MFYSNKKRLIFKMQQNITDFSCSVHGWQFDWLNAELKY